MNKYVLGLVGAAALAGASAANAAVTFTGTTGGCFGNPCTPVSGGGSSVFGLSYTPGGTFTQQDVNGFLTLSNLGTINLATPPAGTNINYGGAFFDLLVSFTSPLNGSTIFTAPLTGTVSGTDGGGVAIQWLNPTVSFGGANPFTLTLNNVSVEQNNPVKISGNITVASGVPEPATWAMMFLGFGGMGLVLRRRRKAVLQQIA